MAIQVQAMGGRSGSISTDKEQHILRFDAWDDTSRFNTNIAELYQTVTAFAPPTFLGLAPTDVSWDEGEEGHTEFEITYASNEPPEATLRVGFDTTGGQVRVRTSRSTSSFPASGRTAPDFKGAVEVSDGEPQGVDVVIPALKLTFTYKWPKGVVTVNDTKFIAGLTGSVNDASWYGFAAGELLFLGATGEIDLVTPTEIQYSFAASANATLSIGSWITGIAKQGHQHLWVLFEDTEDTSAKKRVKRPLAAYVETLYGTADFSTLGIGS